MIDVHGEAEVAIEIVFIVAATILHREGFPLCLGVALLSRGQAVAGECNELDV